jgi:Apea-like HEPN
VEQKPLDDKEIKRGIDLAEHFEQRKLRAQERLSKVTERCWYYAILGLKTEVEQYELTTGIRFQKVIEPPGEVELATALEDGILFSAIGRHSRYITHELAIDRDAIGDNDVCSHIAWGVISALRVRSLAEILVPAACDHSWSTLAGVMDRSCKARLIEDVPMAKLTQQPVDVKKEQFEWVNAQMDRFVELLADQKFRTAIESLTTYNHHYSYRVMVALLWAGVESLFQIEAELSYRISVLAALTLEPRGESCKALYRKVREMYKVRSKAVHGSGVKDEELVEHIGDARSLLSRLLCRFTEKGSIPTRDELDNLVLM